MDSWFGYLHWTKHKDYDEFREYSQKDVTNINKSQQNPNIHLTATIHLLPNNFNSLRHKHKQENAHQPIITFKPKINNIRYSTNVLQLLHTNKLNDPNIFNSFNGDCKNEPIIFH